MTFTQKKSWLAPIYVTNPQTTKLIKVLPPWSWRPLTATFINTQKSKRYPIFVKISKTRDIDIIWRLFREKILVSSTSTISLKCLLPILWLKYSKTHTVLIQVLNLSRIECYKGDKNWIWKFGYSISRSVVSLVQLIYGGNLTLVLSQWANNPFLMANPAALFHCFRFFMVVRLDG